MRQVSELRNQLDKYLLEVTSRNRFIANASSIANDLLELGNEFSVTFSVDNRLISAVTEPIELEEVYFVRFKIRLDVTALTCGNGAYEVIGLDGCHAASDESITHPHVQSEKLCEGEAKCAIDAALRQGRLLDFIHLVNQLLHTYNPSSAYRSLEDWNDVSCSDCGELFEPMMPVFAQIAITELVNLVNAAATMRRLSLRRVQLRV